LRVGRRSAPHGAAAALGTAHLPDSLREIGGPRAAADGDEKCFQGSKTITLLSRVKFSAAIIDPKTVCSFEKSLSFHMSPLVLEKCPLYFGSRIRDCEPGFVPVILSLPHTETNHLSIGHG